jgi:hypothetical protein
VSAPSPKVVAASNASHEPAAADLLLVVVCLRAAMLAPYATVVPPRVGVVRILVGRQSPRVIHARSSLICVKSVLFRPQPAKVSA